MKIEQIALVGAGEGGAAILQTLMKIPGVQIKYVYDVNPKAPGYVLAESKGIFVSTDENYFRLVEDQDLDLIFEVTGSAKVMEKLSKVVNKKVSVVGSAGTQIIFYLLESQQKVAQTLEECKMHLEERIIERTREIETANRVLSAKILEYENLNIKLEQINNEKTKYLLTATHQLKAPFAAIQSYVDIILDGYTGDIPEETRKIIQKIKKRCELLSRSIKEMLELANLKSCITDNLRPETMNIIDVAQEALDLFRPQVEKKNIQLKLITLDKTIPFVGVKDQILILICTLVENAIQYSYENSEIILQLFKAGQIVILSVQDSGIGIPTGSYEKIFTEYYRTNEAVKKHENGTGLGLAIAKEIAQIHFGGISVSSELGKGSTFTVTLHGLPINNKGQ